MNLIAQQELQTTIAAKVFQLLHGRQWSTAWVAYSQIAESSTAWFTPKDEQGEEINVSLPIDVFDDFAALRNAMADPQTGAWYLAELNLTPDGKMRYSFNYDKRVFWASDNPLVPEADDEGDDPSVDDFLRDLGSFPRTAQHLPEWLPAGSATAPEQSSVESLLARPTSLSPELAPLQQAWGWPGIIESVRVSVEKLVRQSADAGDISLEPSDRGRLAEVLDGMIEFVIEDVDGEVLNDLTVAQYQRLWSEGTSALGRDSTLQEPGVAADALARDSQSDAGVTALTTAVVRLVVEVASDTLEALFGVEPDELGTVNASDAAGTAFFDGRPELVDAAARFLSTDRDAVLANHRELPEDDAVYVWQPVRGGNAIILAADGSVLWSNSSIPFEQHLEVFRTGRRTDPEAFTS